MSAGSSGIISCLYYSLMPGPFSSGSVFQLRLIYYAAVGDCQKRKF